MSERGWEWEVGFAGNNRDTRIAGKCNSRIRDASKQNITWLECYTSVGAMHYIFSKLNSGSKRSELWKTKMTSNPPDLKVSREAHGCWWSVILSPIAQGDLVTHGDVFGHTWRRNCSWHLVGRDEEISWPASQLYIRQHLPTKKHPAQSVASAKVEKGWQEPVYLISSQMCWDY